MTILPKKKQNAGKSGANDDNVESERNERYSNFGHHSHSRAHSPNARWPARSDEKRSANDSDVSLDGGPSHSKRRHRVDMRSMRKNKSVNSGVDVVSVDSSESDNNQCAIAGSSNGAHSEGNADVSGYNSGDEYDRESKNWTKEELEEKERLFEKKLCKKGLKIKKMGEDGACLFRAVGMYQ